MLADTPLWRYVRGIRDRCPSLRRTFPFRSREDTPLVTRLIFGPGFVINYCQGCHASKTLDRYGALTGITFDPLDQVKPYRDRLFDLVVGSEATMPSVDGINQPDLKRLIVWINCASEMK